MRFLLSNRKLSNRTKRHGIHLNLFNFFVLILFYVINIFVFKYNLHEDISSDVESYSMTCGSIVKTASDHICYGSCFRLYPGKISILYKN